MKKRNDNSLSKLIAIIILIVALVSLIYTIIIKPPQLAPPQIDPANSLTFLDSSAQLIAALQPPGDILLKGNCIVSSLLNPPPNSYEIKNNAGGVVSYIDESGNLYIKTGNCDDNSASCNTQNNALVISDNTGAQLITIDDAGDLCLIGTLYQNAPISTCLPAWVARYTTCVGGAQYLYYTDTNNCPAENGLIGLPLPQTTASPTNRTLSAQPTSPCTFCTERWTCNAWNPVTCNTNTNRTRICTDSNRCGTNITRPVETFACLANEQDMCGELSNSAIIRINELGQNVVLKEGSNVSSGSYFAIPEQTSGVFKVASITNVSTGSTTFANDNVQLENAIGHNLPVTYRANAEGRIVAPITQTHTYTINYFGSEQSAQSNRYIQVDFPQTIGEIKGTFYECVADCVPDWGGGWSAWTATGNSCTTAQGQPGQEEKQTREDSTGCSSPQTATRCIASCAVWEQRNTTCTSNDILTSYYINTNQACTGTTLGLPPPNQTLDCDYGGLGLIGNETEISKVDINVELFIEGERANYATNYTGGTKTLEMKKPNADDVIVKFNHNFATPLNLRKIFIKKQASSTSFGYLIVNGISDEKTVRLDKVRSGVNKVCVEEREMNSITGISDDCRSSGEELVNCPGVNGDLNCTVETNFFAISGLDNSAVKEFGGVTNTTGGCASSWDCTGFGACISGQQSQTCADLNNCRTPTLSNRPPLTQSCQITGCTSSWDCGAWSSCTNDRQTRTCTDRNSCGTSSGKPNEQQTCTKEKSKISTAVIISLIVGIVALGIVITAIIFYRRAKRRQRLQTMYNYSTPVK